MRKYGSWAQRGIFFALAILLSGAFALMVACTSDGETETEIVETAEPEVKAVATGTQPGSGAAEKTATQRPLRFTRTPTFTVTSTFTATATHTPVPTDTPPPEPTLTHTPTPTPTYTPVPTPTDTPTAVPTPTETPVPPTPTAIPTATSVPTDTATPTPTDIPEANIIAALALIDDLIKLSTALVELNAMSIEEWDRDEVDALTSRNTLLMERVAELESASEGKRSPELDRIAELSRLNAENIKPLHDLTEAPPEPTATLTPEPTATFTPTPSPTPTPEPSPTSTPTPEPTAIPSPTPTATVTPTPTPESVTDLTLRWTFRTGVSGSVATTASDADLTVRDGVVYAGSKDNKIYAIYASSGQEKWSYNAGSDVTSGGVLSEDGAILYFGTDHTGFFALDTDDGSRRWSYEPDRIDRFEAKPTLYENKIIAAADNRIYAFEADSTSANEGRLLWAAPKLTRDSEYGRFRESGTAYRGSFYIGNDDGTLHGFNTDNGRSDGKPRLRATQMPYCLDDERCKSDDDFEPLRTAVVRNGMDIYFGNDAGELIQYTGDQTRWVFRTASERNVRGDIAATDEFVVFADRSGAIYAVNPDPEEATKRATSTWKKPERIWIESTEDRRWIVGGPVISGDYVYVIDSHGLLYMIDLERGKTRYTLDLWLGDDPCVSCRSTPAIEDDMLFVGTQDGTIVGVQLPIYAD